MAISRREWLIGIGGLVTGILGALGIQKINVSNNKNTKKVSTIPLEKRVEMFQQGIGLPPDYWKPGWGEYPGFINEQKGVLKSIALYGEYNPELGSDRYISQEHAKELLKLYGWDNK